MSTIVSTQRARTAALIAAALLAAGCADGGTLTAPARLTRAGRQAATPGSTIGLRDALYSGYALASGRAPDSTATPTGK